MGLNYNSKHSALNKNGFLFIGGMKKKFFDETLKLSFSVNAQPEIQILN